MIKNISIQRNEDKKKETKPLPQSHQLSKEWHSLGFDVFERYHRSFNSTPVLPTLVFVTSFLSTFLPLFLFLG